MSNEKEIPFCSNDINNEINGFVEILIRITPT